VNEEIYRTFVIPVLGSHLVSSLSLPQKKKKKKEVVDSDEEEEEVRSCSLMSQCIRSVQITLTRTHFVLITGET
jgi:hypothetical protein